MPGGFCVWLADDFYGPPVPMDADFEALSRTLEQTRKAYADKKAAPLIFAGGFRDGATAKSAEFLDASRFPPFAFVDLDKVGVLTCEEVITRFAEVLQGARADLWTTYSHGERCTRMRAFIALTRGPASLEEFGLVWAALNAHPGGLLAELGSDEATSDATRGQAAPSAPLGLQSRYFRLPGLALSTDALVAFARERGLKTRTPKARPQPAENWRPTVILTAEMLRAYAERHATADSGQTLSRILSGQELAPEGERHKPRLKMIHAVQCELGPCEPTQEVLDLLARSCNFSEEQWLDAFHEDREVAEAYHAENERVRASYGSDGPWEPGEWETLPASARALLEALPTAVAANDTTLTSLAAMQRDIANATALSAAYDWVIKAPGGFFLRADDDYRGPWGDQMAVKNAARDILPAQVFGCWRTVKGQFATPCFLEMDEILHKYGSSPQVQDYSYYAPRSTLAGSVFTQRIAHVRGDLAPEYCAPIDRWLGLFGGQHADALRDWLATVTELGRGTCAVLAQGAKGTGKDLFAAGLASLWSGTFTTFADAVSPFNPGLLRSPVVFANESLAVSRGLGETALDALKKMITNGEHRVADKHVKESKLRGYVRVILAANSGGLFDFGRIPTPDDLAALQERVLLLNPPSAAAEYLKSIGGMDTTLGWIQGGAFARHVLWLRDNRQVRPGARLLVEGRGDLATMVTAGSPAARPLLGALVNVLTGGKRADIAYVSEGRVWASGTALQKAWEALSKEAVPEDWSDAWNFVCESGSSQTRKPTGHEPRKMRRVRLDVLRADAARRGLAEELAAVLAGDEPGRWALCGTGAHCEPTRAGTAVCNSRA